MLILSGPAARPCSETWALAIVLIVGAASAERTVTDLDSCQQFDVNCNARDVAYNDYCIELLRNHVQIELEASLQYLAMAAHFNQDSVNRLGIAEFFFKSASEERHHAIEFIKYIMMRGETNATVIGDIHVSRLLEEFEKSHVTDKNYQHGIMNSSSFVLFQQRPRNTSWPDALSAFKHALDMEKKVTLLIQVITQACSKLDDFHATDFLTTKFLDEQLHGLRDLSGKIANLQKLITTNPSLGEFLFDLELQSE